MREIGKNVIFSGGEVVFIGVDDEKLVEVYPEAEIDDSNLIIPVKSVEEAFEVYREVLKLIRNTPLIEKLGFSYKEVFGYGFLVYLNEYKSGIEDELMENPARKEFDIVTLPNKDGYYYSTLYGLDNLNIPALLVVGNLYAEELRKLVEKSPSLMELFELKKLKEKMTLLERFGEAGTLQFLRSLEKIEAVDEIVKKMLAVRFSFSIDLALAGKVEHSELQKIRKLGNGLGIYLSRSVRNKVSLQEGDLVSVRVLDGKLLAEKVNESGKTL
ncbi:hypothetical protein [Archaeoglobus sp.]|uniref:AbrB/MazE/SpoVT family DNA-binding domain-containing protein n=1 Tax=Archaeoglobus sp. TaxID=1872626 RepID=UPI0024AB42C5|nr:hypothetical protein [Archaeoglobus sp.]MDI3498158.1 hypothetical protein [Archaeoglobus sp.]